MKKWILTAFESILLIFTFSCLELSYSVYFGDALKGTYEYGIGLLLFGWVPGLIGLVLIPLNIFMIIMIIIEFRKMFLKRKTPAKTIKQLERYLEEECFSFTGLTIGKHCAPEGYVIKQSGNGFIFGYTERGNWNILKTFATEQELVTYAQNQLESDKWAKAHLAAWTRTEDVINSIERELQRLNISYERNDIPLYDVEHGKAYRIFVFGKDIKKLTAFRENHTLVKRG